MFSLTNTVSWKQRKLLLLPSHSSSKTQTILSCANKLTSCSGLLGFDRCLFLPSCLFSVQSAQSKNMCDPQSASCCIFGTFAYYIWTLGGIVIRCLLSAQHKRLLDDNGDKPSVNLIISGLTHCFCLSVINPLSHVQNVGRACSRNSALSSTFSRGSSKKKNQRECFHSAVVYSLFHSHFLWLKVLWITVVTTDCTYHQAAQRQPVLGVLNQTARWVCGSEGV